MVRLNPAPITLPAPSSTTAPTGTSPRDWAWAACSSARRMASTSSALNGSADASSGRSCSAAINARIERDAAGQALHRLFQPLIELGLFVVAGLVQIGDPPFLDETPGAAALVAVARVPHAEGHAARAPYEREARDVGIAVAHEDHLLEGYAQLV